MPTTFMPISADTSIRRWTAAGLGDRAQYVATFLRSAVNGLLGIIDEIRDDWPALRTNR
jgi:hypothetical protein